MKIIYKKYLSLQADNTYLKKINECVQWKMHALRNSYIYEFWHENKPIKWAKWTYAWLHHLGWRHGTMRSITWLLSSKLSIYIYIIYIYICVIYVDFQRNKSKIKQNQQLICWRIPSAPEPFIYGCRVSPIKKNPILITTAIIIFREV